MRFPGHTRSGGAGTDGKAEFTLAMDPDLLAFQGHFPDNPIVPGVMQVDWAVHFGALAFGPLGAFAGIEHLKFMDLIRPGEELCLTLSLDTARENLKFAYQGAKGRKSAGTLRFTGKGSD